MLRSLSQRAAKSVQVIGGWEDRPEGRIIAEESEGLLVGRDIKRRAGLDPVLANLEPLYHIITNCQVVFSKSFVFREI